MVSGYVAGTRGFSYTLAGWGRSCATPADSSAQTGLGCLALRLLYPLRFPRGPLLGGTKWHVL
jgi:hypothetical protein